MQVVYEMCGFLLKVKADKRGEKKKKKKSRRDTIYNTTLTKATSRLIEAHIVVPMPWSNVDATRL